MKKNNFQFKTLMLAIFAFAMLTFTSCKEDEPAAAIEIVSINAVGTDLTTGNEVTIDLNGTTTATDVPVNSVITITFGRALDASTISSSTVTLASGSTSITSTTSVSGESATITGESDLTKGTILTLLITDGVKASDGGSFVESSRTFKTAGKAPGVIPQEENVVVHVSFDGSVTEANGHTVLNDNVGFAVNRFGEVDAAGDFNGTTNYVGIEYGTDMSNANTTVSYWMKLPSSQAYMDHVGTTSVGDIKQYVTFGIGGNNGTYHEFNRFTCCDLGCDIYVLKYFTNHVNSGSASDLAGSSIEMKNEGNPGGDKTVEVNNIPWLEEQTGEWVHIVTSWEASTHRKAFYINGVPSTVYELTPSAEYSLDAATIDVTGIDSDATNNKNLYLGTGVPFWATITDGVVVPFRSNIPFAFKGQMDDFRMFSVALTDAEVLQLYEAESPE